MNSLGIFFGPKIIGIVEAKGKKILNNIQINRNMLVASEVEEKVPDELKLVALFKDELRRNKIEVSEATLALSGKDLIIRTFEMPLLPSDELKSAVTFEAKKYIPFKVEDLVSDYQVEVDKANKRNLVLFVGIKKDILNKYISILNQLNIRIVGIEYSAFSVLRVLKMASAGNKGTCAVINLDFQEDDEINFTVLQNGFPLFSRDITLTGISQETGEVMPQEPGMLIEKLKTELRISIDFYNRKFPNKKIEKVFLISSEEYRTELESFMKEIGQVLQYIDVGKYIGRPITFSLSFIKGYSCCLTKIVKTNIKIDLLTVKTSVVGFKETAALAEGVASLFTGFKLDPKMLILAVAICSMTFGYGIYRTTPLTKELKSIVAMRPSISAAVNSESSIEELSTIDNQYKDKVAVLDKIIKKQFYLTEPLNIIPKVIPEGVWLTDFSFIIREEQTELKIQGIAYLANSDKELESVNAFLSNLKQNQEFAKVFKDVKILSVDHSDYEKTSRTSFTILCQTLKK